MGYDCYTDKNILKVEQSYGMDTQRCKKELK